MILIGILVLAEPDLWQLLQSENEHQIFDFDGKHISHVKVLWILLYQVLGGLHYLSFICMPKKINLIKILKLLIWRKKLMYDLFAFFKRNKTIDFHIFHMTTRG